MPFVKRRSGAGTRRLLFSHLKGRRRTETVMQADKVREKEQVEEKPGQVEPSPVGREAGAAEALLLLCGSVRDVAAQGTSTPDKSSPSTPSPSKYEEVLSPKENVGDYG